MTEKENVTKEIKHEVKYRDDGIVVVKSRYGKKTYTQVLIWFAGTETVKRITRYEDSQELHIDESTEEVFNSLDEVIEDTKRVNEDALTQKLQKQY